MEMAKRKGKFCVIENGEDDPENGYSFETEWNSAHGEWIAEDAAQSYHQNNDGWEDSWPLTFAISVEGEYLGRFTVELEFEPTFSARQVGASQVDQEGTP